MRARSFPISRARFATVGAAALAAVVIAAVALGRRGPAVAAAPSATPRASAVWPDDDASVVAIAPVFPADFGVHRVVIDAGHGAENNRGNQSCFCVDEQDFTRIAAALFAARLEATGHFEVRVSRDEAPVAYADRVDDAEAFAAEAFVSLHSDVRGRLSRWSPDAGADCPLSVEAPGFSVLFSDEDEDDGAPVASRRALARALSSHMIEAGFLALASDGYADNYLPDARGVFVDRHATGQRIFVLRKPSMPSVILETHNAVEPRDARRWAEAETFDAAADALSRALVDVLAKR